MEVTHDVSKKSACHKSWIRKKNPGKECNGLSMLPPQFLYCEQPLKSRQTYLTIFLAVLRQRLIGTKRCAYANFNSVWNSDNNVTSHIESCVNKRRAMTVTVKNLEENIFRSLFQLRVQVQLSLKYTQAWHCWTSSGIESMIWMLRGSIRARRPSYAITAIFVTNRIKMSF